MVLRRIIAWAGLLCVLLHAGAVVQHGAMSGVDGLGATAPSGATAGAAGDLAHALVASMCRPQGAQPDPLHPSGTGLPCLACCCLASQALVPAVALRGVLISPERETQSAAWPARALPVDERSSERPPVRGPPAIG